MCGIGFLLASSPAEQLTLDRCLDVLRRRGPDADKTTLVELQARSTRHDYKYLSGGVDSATVVSIVERSTTVVALVDSLFRV